MSDRSESWTRRELVGGLTLAGVAGLLGTGVGVVAAEPPPETTKLRVLRTPSLCEAPAQVADVLLAAEGFTQVEYVRVGGAGAAVQGLTAGEIDLGLVALPVPLLRIDAGAPLVVLGGVHAGCFELFGSDRIRSIREMRGKAVAIPGLGSNQPRGIPVMAMTASVMTEDRRRITDAGFDAYQSKPINVKDFVAAVERLLDHPRK